MTALSVARHLHSSVRIDDMEERRGVFSGRRYERPSAVNDDEPGFAEAADLYYRRPPRTLAYRHFENADEALRFVHDHLSTSQVGSAILEVGERRYGGAEVAAMARRLGPGGSRRYELMADA